ncbi:MAG TPA: HEAT repeat domain-containing protein [Planctomycetota bacterium]|jgi:HEAT repeat protein|nr:HEAT repeat domain-containing protein [Planctomycetota bacterium]
MLHDPSEPIRIAAIESLGTIKAKEALPRLVENVKKGVSMGQREAAGGAVDTIDRVDKD